ncbi:MAG: carboxypeptidase regulatory-like domain-containing protein [Proteobacteria bacterium]|nr:carboxypeptidase regulatory-like domain-containing protein [Pseudomonadota bacterium]
MIRLPLLLVLAASPLAVTAADTCTVAGTAYDFQGRPLPNAVVRLVDTRTQQARFLATDEHAVFDFVGISAAADYRVDVLSAPTRVTGTRIPTRSILGMSANFACGAGQLARQDVRAQVD